MTPQPIAYVQAPYVLCAIPRAGQWEARALLGECTVADAAGETAEAAIEALRARLLLLQRPARLRSAAPSSSQARS